MNENGVFFQYPHLGHPEHLGHPDSDAHHESPSVGAVSNRAYASRSVGHLQGPNVLKQDLQDSQDSQDERKRRFLARASHLLDILNILCILAILIQTRTTSRHR